MADDGGVQAEDGGDDQINVHIDFTVKAREDLYLSGSENTIRRVVADTNYNCLMLKKQRFSSLFRHYAKYHGLRRDDLEYSFVYPLENEDTPESVQLQRGDIITVRKRRKPEPPEAAADDEKFFKSMKEMLDDDEHMDCIFLVFPDGFTITDESTDTSPSNDHPHHHDHAGIGKSSTSPAAAHVTESSTTSRIATTATPENKPNVKQRANDDKKHGMDTIDNINDSTNATAATAASASIAETATTTAISAPMATASNTITDFGNKIPIRAHKCILTARAEYFRALFRNSQHTATTTSNIQISSCESEECIIRVEPDFGPIHIRCLLEFIYTNRIQQIKDISTDDLLSLLNLSDRWLLKDLKRLVEHELIRNHMSISTVARIYGATEDFNAQHLSAACIDFILDNLGQLTGNAAFEEEIENYFHLCIPILKAAVDLVPKGRVPKKQRTDHHRSSNSNNDPSSNKNNTCSGGMGGGGEGGGGSGGGPGGSASGGGSGGPGGCGEDGGEHGSPEGGGSGSNNNASSSAPAGDFGVKSGSDDRGGSGLAAAAAAAGGSGGGSASGCNAAGAGGDGASGREDRGSEAGAT